MAAGLGFKDFVTGEVLTAADVDGYLMQGVWVFASAAARDAAVTSPQEGNFAYLKDTNVTTYYTGSAWANLDTTGMTNPMTTTGDTIYSSSGSTPARLGIGSTGQVLTVAAGIPSWATPAGGGSGLTYVGGATFSASATVNLNNVFTSTYANYRIVANYTASNTSSLYVRLRASGTDNTNATYDYQNISAGSTSVNASRANSQTAWAIVDKDTSGNTIDATIFNPQTAIRTLMSDINISYSGEFWSSNAFGFLATTSFDGISFFPASGTITGTIRVYGLANS